MLRLAAVQVIRNFTINNKTQNFFQINPVYPDYGQKDFDLYNSDRKKIYVLDAYVEQQNKTKRLNNLIKEKIYRRSYQRFRRITGGKGGKIDKDTFLVRGIDSDFDDYLKEFRRQKLTDVKAKSEFKQTLTKLIQRFKCKSEVELIKLFRISLAHTKKKSLHDKLRGTIIEEAILQTSEEQLNSSKKRDFKNDQQEDEENEEREQVLKNKRKIREFRSLGESNNRQNTDKQAQQAEKQADEEELAFYKALKQLDEKIEKAQEIVKYDIRGVPNRLSDYDPKYGWRVVRQQTRNKEIDTNTWLGHFEKVKISTSQTFNDANFHDWTIKNHINRLYFLRRQQFLKEGNFFEDNKFFDELPNSIRKNEKLMNQLAHIYKESQTIQIPDLGEIYNEVDTLINNVVINIKSDRKKGHSQSIGQVYDRVRPEAEFLWQNINAEQILCESLYSNQGLKEIKVTPEVMMQVSPHAETELSLTRIPINLYRHSELQCIGLFNENKKKINDYLFNHNTTEFEPDFEQFTTETAYQKFRKAESKVHVKTTSSFGKARRKTAFATANIKEGTGVVTVNGMPIQDYFGDTFSRVQALKPLVFTDTSGMYDVSFNVFGSGFMGQGQCMGYALARALIKLNPEHKRILSQFGLVGSDFRKKEPKKTNLYSARVRPPYVRR